MKRKENKRKAKGKMLFHSK